jgi:GTP pyrophosphokinase
MDINTILEAAAVYLPQVDLRIIENAYQAAAQAHEGQTRESGEPYIQHSLSVAHRLVELGLDASTVSAGLLHDVVEQTALTLDQVGKEFGDEIARLVDGMTKLSGVDENMEERGS